MALSLFNKNKNTFTALFDIGTGSVTASVISLPSDTDKSGPTIVWHYEIKLDFHTRPDKRRLLSKVLDATQTVAGAMHRDWPEAISEAHVVLASPFYRALTKTVQFEHDEPFTLNQGLLDKIQTDEIAKFLATAKKPFADLPRDEAVMLEYRLLSVLADGELLNEPYKRGVQNVELTEYLSLGSEVIIKRLKQIIIGAGHFKKVNFHSYLLTVAAVLAALYKENDFLVVDAGGERTDVGLVQNGLLINQYSFSLSPKHLARLAAQKQLTTRGEAATLVHLHPEHRLWSDHRGEWWRNFKQALSRFGAPEEAPRQVFIGAEPNYQPLLAGWLKELDFKPVLLTPDWLTNWCAVAPGVQGASEYSPLLAAMFLAQVASEGPELL